VKEFNKGRLRLGLEGTSSMASWLAQQQLLTGEVKTIDEVIERIELVTVEDLHRVAGQVLAAPPQLAVVGPFSSDAKFSSALGI
ncbi:MAG: insulinase family protein, partial [Candidatus Dormibacteraceae bacterium]